MRTLLWNMQINISVNSLRNTRKLQNWEITDLTFSQNWTRIWLFLINISLKEYVFKVIIMIYGFYFTFSLSFIAKWPNRRFLSSAVFWHFSMLVSEKPEMFFRFFHWCYKIGISIRVFHSVCNFGYFSPMQIRVFTPYPEFLG